jgi:hypothetical protein
MALTTTTASAPNIGNGFDAGIGNGFDAGIGNDGGSPTTAIAATTTTSSDVYHWKG